MGLIQETLRTFLFEHLVLYGELSSAITDIWTHMSS